MGAPIFVAEYESTWDVTTSPRSVSVTVVVDDVLVVVAGAENNGVNWSTPTMTGVTWTLRQNLGPTFNDARVAIWTGVATQAGTFTLQVAITSGTQRWGFNCLRFAGSDGIGASNSVVVDGVPTIGLTTTGANSAVVGLIADWNAVDGTSRTWLSVGGAAVEQTYFRDSVAYTVFAARWDNVGTAGAKTIGLSAPGAQHATVGAVEILGSAKATLEVVPTEDTMVAENNAAFVYGAEDQLSARTDTGTTIESYMRFTLPPLPDGMVLAEARLRVFTSSDPTAGSVGTHPILLMTGTWSEGSTNWNNRPLTGFGAEVGLLSGATALSTFYSAQLDTGALAPLLGGSVALCMRSNSTDNIRIRSKDLLNAGNTAPSLVLTFRDGFSLYSMVVDDFNDADVGNGGMWASGGDYSLADTGGLRTITTTATGPGKQYFEIIATEDFVAGGRYYGIELVNPGDIMTSNTLMIAPMRMFPSNDTGRAFWRIRTGEGGGGTVLQPWHDATGFSPVGTPIAFNAAVHRFFAIGIGSTGKVEWLWSSDGNNWVLHFSEANPWGVTTFKKFGGEVGPDSGTPYTATSVSFDNFRVLSVTPLVPEGTANFAISLSLTATAPVLGSANFPLSLSLAAAGEIPTGVGEGTSNFDLTLTVAATGIAPTIGSANFSIPLDLAATGVNNISSEGTADFSLSLELTAIGVAVVLTPVRVLSREEILTGNRNTTFYLDWLDGNENPLGRLDGITNGELDWIANAMVKGGGKLTVQDKGQVVDWLTARFRPWMLIEGLEPQPLGIFLVSEAPDFHGRNRSWEVKLLDKTTILDQDTVASTYGLPAGTVITTEVQNLIESAGITNYAITLSSATLPGPLVWEAGTSKLRIINDLLALANYFSLYMNFEGQLIAEPYTLPAARPIFYEFVDGDKSIYEPNFKRDVDLWSIPNRVTVVSQGDGANAALTSTIDNVDPFSPYSIPSRGRVIGKVENGVEIADQLTLDAYARRRLVELTSPTASVQVKHAPVPALAVNNAVRFRRVPAGIDRRHVVAKTVLKLDGTALATSIFREVVDL